MDILIVDSSTEIIERQAEMVSEAEDIGTIHRALCCTRALSLFIINKPEVVLLNTGLMDSRSFDLLKKIKEIRNNTVVIVLSIYADRHTKQQFLLAGADYFFDKYHEFEKAAVIIQKRASELLIHFEHKNQKP
jgi:DNA-binding NarL/FixJ family response regulator